MKRASSIFLLGIVLAGMAYGSVYWITTSRPRAILRSSVPELAWLQQEFQLPEEEFVRISKLHDGYQSKCHDMCRRIDEKNAELQQLLAHAESIGPEIEQKLQEAAQLRVECQKRMLEHFMEVSRTMPEDQGRRYLAWVQSKTFRMDHRGSMESALLHGEH